MPISPGHLVRRPGKGWGDIVETETHPRRSQQQMYKTSKKGRAKITSKIKLATWNKGRGCFEKLLKKRDKLEMILHVYAIDILAVTKANFDIKQTEEECVIKGFDIHWEKGREHTKRMNAMVVVYVKQGLDVKVEKKWMKENLVPKVWLSVGELGMKSFLIGAIYSVNTSLGSKSELGTRRAKHRQSKQTDGRDGLRKRQTHSTGKRK